MIRQIERRGSIIHSYNVPGWQLEAPKFLLPIRSDPSFLLSINPTLEERLKEGYWNPWGALQRRVIDAFGLKIGDRLLLIPPLSVSDELYPMTVPSSPNEYERFISDIQLITLSAISSAHFHDYGLSYEPKRFQHQLEFDLKLNDHDPVFLCIT